jgi:RimJ/RimL family protein N-acetyltransferase
MNFMIETDRLILRDYSLSDIARFSEMNEDSKFQRFYSEEDCSPEKWQRLIRSFIEESKENPRNNFNLAISLRTDNSFIGSAGIRIEDNQQAASVGCSLTRKFQHSGIALEAMSAVVEFGFEKLRLHRIYAEIISENKAAIILCKKLGMRKEAEFIEHRHFKNRWWNTVVFALLNSEYQQIDITSAATG